METYCLLPSGVQTGLPQGRRRPAFHRPHRHPPLQSRWTAPACPCRSSLSFGPWLFPHTRPGRARACPPAALFTTCMETGSARLMMYSTALGGIPAQCDGWDGILESGDEGRARSACPACRHLLRSSALHWGPTNPHPHTASLCPLLDLPPLPSRTWQQCPNPMPPSPT